MSSWLFTSESVTEGHPDKVADRISDSVLDAVLTGDPEGRVACETLVTTRLVVVAGELATSAQPDLEAVARNAIHQVGYDGFDPTFAADTVHVDVVAHAQSPDIADGVVESWEHRNGSTDSLDAIGAGDQGLVFGFAVDETPEFMPLPIQLAHRLAERLAEVRRDGTLPCLRPDGKTQVTVIYEGDRPVAIKRLLISSQHAPEIDLEAGLAPDLWKHVVTEVVPPELLDGVDPDHDFLVNPTGRFEIGGPNGDTGLTGRKIIVDTYGGYARHGGGAFSGKDPTKVDRSAAYAARHAAKNVVAAGLAKRCELQVAYAIGVAQPMSVHLETFGTEQVDPQRLGNAVREFFDFRPSAILERFGLRRPIYTPTSAYGHFGRPGFPWESTDAAADLALALSP
jgi:S-adenosylmethionine synthetase